MIDRLAGIKEMKGIARRNSLAGLFSGYRLIDHPAIEAAAPLLLEGGELFCWRLVARLCAIASSNPNPRRNKLPRYSPTVIPSVEFFTQNAVHEISKSTHHTVYCRTIYRDLRAGLRG